jgi:F-type H+-transporting ATPase subunit delta
VAERATIARPYAKAAFDAARDANALAGWSQGLGALAQIVADPRVTAVVGNPEIGTGEIADFIIDVAGGRLDPHMQNFVRVLAENRRLPLLPEVAAQYEMLRSEAENTVDVDVISAIALDAAQSETLKRALTSRLKRTVRMRNSVDAALLGGAVIHAGDLVIDGSLKGRLQRLRTELTS